MTKNELKKCKAVFNGKAITVFKDVDDDYTLINNKTGKLYTIAEVVSWKSKAKEVKPTYDICMLLELDLDENEVSDAKLFGDDVNDLDLLIKWQQNRLVWTFGASLDHKDIFEFFDEYFTKHRK